MTRHDFIFCSCQGTVRRFLLLFLLIFQSLPVFAQEPIYFLVSCIWEGRDLQKHNLEAIERFRLSYDVPILHLVSAAYFTKPDGHPAEASKRLQQIIKPNDETGLYLQPWQSLTHAADVNFRSDTTFWGYALEKDACVNDCGAEVPLSGFAKADIEKITAHSLAVFAHQGLGRPQSVAVGGWLGSPDISKVLKSHDFKFDLSPVPPSLLKKRLALFPLFNWLNARWHQVTPFTAPFPIKTSEGTIVGVPQTAAMVDYVNVDEMAQIFRAQIDRRQSRQSQPLLFHVGFHQETAMQFLPRLGLALDRIKEQAAAAKISLQPVPLPLDTGADVFDDL